jgi:peptidoglycan/LPS O-acetylase OafA/YrhL
MMSSARGEVIGLAGSSCDALSKFMISSDYNELKPGPSFRILCSEGRRVRTGGEKLHSVHYLRGLAALAVVWYHFSLSTKGVIESSASFGYLGVVVFFVISGFIIPFSLSGSDYQLVRDGPAFFVRRLVRLEPPYLVAVALSVVLLFAGTATPWFKGVVPPRFWFSVALHPLYLVPWFDADWLNIVFWTLAIEFQFYIIVLLAGHALLSHSALATRTILIAAITLSWFIHDHRTIFGWAPFFLFGYLHFLRSQRSMRLNEFLVWVAVCVPCVFANPLPYQNWSPLATVIAALCTVVALSIMWPKNLRLLTFLGTISYSLYLVHVPIGTRVFNIFGRFELGPIGPAIAMVSAFAATLAVAYLLWRFVEAPAQAASRQVAWDLFYARGKFTSRTDGPRPSQR